MPMDPRAHSRFLYFCSIAFLGLACASAGRSHDVITSTVTFNREVRAIFQAYCVSCHQTGGTAFSLTSYADARPWAKAIEEEVLQRRMPPWSAVRGFGEFRNDPTLSMSEMQQLAEWAEGGAPEGVGHPDQGIASLSAGAGTEARATALLISGETKLRQRLNLDGLEIVQALPGASFRLTAHLPDGRVIPLLWIDQFNPIHRWQFLLREPLALPRGSVIKGLPATARLALLPTSR